VIVAGRRRDPLESAIEEALAPGAFIGYRGGASFVEGLEAVRARIVSLVGRAEAARAVALLETFIAGCYEKSEEIDGSSGGFGMFVEEIFCDWIRARQGAKADPADTATRLLDWMERDEYGYCSGLAKKVVEVLDRKGLTAFERAVRERPCGGADGSYARRRRVEILKTIHAARRDVDAYRTVCEAQGDLPPRDCEVLAEMCLKRRRPEEALAWVERGLEQEKKRSWPESAWRLRDLDREILTKLGRSDDALASAWEDYRRSPSTHSYDDLMTFVPKGGRPEWHEKAMTALAGVDLAPTIDLLVETKELERLGSVVDLATRESLIGLSHYTTEPAAKKLEGSHPLLAAKLRIAMALRILDAKKSKYYDAALANLGKARKVLLREGRPEEWEALAREIREAHRRKTGFMSDFERLAEKPSKEPSFLDRARERWATEPGRRREGR